ncbi:hypothetical protein TNCV_4586611 [Trichonephila clavipes]|nr:hypothetical protein TNCV_4586611 [Trichonephila clavipes]
MGCYENLNLCDVPYLPLKVCSRSWNTLYMFKVFLELSKMIKSVLIMATIGAIAFVTHFDMECLIRVRQTLRGIHKPPQSTKVDLM